MRQSSPDGRAFPAHRLSRVPEAVFRSEYGILKHA